MSDFEKRLLLLSPWSSEKILLIERRLMGEK